MKWCKHVRRNSNSREQGTFITRDSLIVVVVVDLYLSSHLQPFVTN